MASTTPSPVTSPGSTLNDWLEPSKPSETWSPFLPTTAVQPVEPITADAARLIVTVWVEALELRLAPAR